MCRVLAVYIFMCRESKKEEEGNAALRRSGGKGGLQETSVEISMDSCFKILKYFISYADKLNAVYAYISLHTEQSTRV